MKMDEAMEIIDEHEARINEPVGYMVSFERMERGMLISGYFPDKHAGEPLITIEEEAWDLAKRFNAATCDDYVNIYVMDQRFVPVGGYKSKELSIYPKPTEHR